MVYGLTHHLLLLGVHLFCESHFLVAAVSHEHLVVFLLVADEFVSLVDDRTVAAHDLVPAVDALDHLFEPLGRVWMLLELQFPRLIFRLRLQQDNVLVFAHRLV